jgi:hypothetical protein
MENLAIPVQKIVDTRHVLEVRAKLSIQAQNSVASLLGLP